jgi:SAM-dependent methyltransferase
LERISAPTSPQLALCLANEAGAAHLVAGNPGHPGDVGFTSGSNLQSSGNIDVGGITMPDLRWNHEVWGEAQNWHDAGEGWSVPWGNSEAQWFGSLYPRLHRFLPARNILEIAPGLGRWTRFLLPLCDNYVGIDLAPVCIAACRNTFSDAGHAKFIQNDGMSLAQIPDSSINLVFSFDSLVHADFDVFESYIPQIIQKLTANGVAFLHHSNLLAHSGSSLVNIHNRSLSVSAANVGKLIAASGGDVLVQELIDWVNSPISHDCFTVFVKSLNGKRQQPIIISNTDFMIEASIVRNYQSYYSRIYTGPGIKAPPAVSLWKNISNNMAVVKRGEIGHRTSVGSPALVERESGTRVERESGTRDLEDALVACRAALEERPRDRVPVAWAQAQNNLGTALWRLGMRESGTARLQEAVTAYRAALEEYTRDRVPLGWAQTQNNLGNALIVLSERETGTARLQEAAAAYDAALEAFIAVGADHYVGVCRKNRNIVSELLAQSEEGTKGAARLPNG